MPGYPNSLGIANSCCIPSTTPPPPRLCGCSTSSSGTIPQKVQIDLSRVIGSLFSTCLGCTNLNGTYILRPSILYWGSTFCTWDYSFDLSLTGSSSALAANCTNQHFTWLAQLAVQVDSTNSQWIVRLFNGTNLWAPEWTWQFLGTRPWFIPPVPWYFPCANVDHSTYFYNWLGGAYRVNNCEFAYYTTVIDPLDTPKPLEGDSTFFPHIVITPSTST